MVESILASGLVEIEPDDDNCNSLRYDLKVLHGSDGSREAQYREMIVGTEYFCELRCEYVPLEHSFDLISERVNPTHS